MNDDMRTAEKFMQAVNAMKTSLDTEGLEKRLGLELAVRHNLRRKLRMIRAMQGLYRHLHGNASLPAILPSAAFNPSEGVDRANIHYFFKEMTAVPPWALRKDQLVLPTALTLLMLEIAFKLFPSPQVHRHLLLVQEFVNRWSMPKFRPEWTEEELDEQIARYHRDMENLENRFRQSYDELSIYFGALEKPDRNPVVKQIAETHKNARAIAAKVCGKEPATSFVAQAKALQIWKQYRNSPEVKTRYCRPRHRISYADIFDYCKREIVELGFTTAKAFGKAVLAASRREKRSHKFDTI